MSTAVIYSGAERTDGNVTFLNFTSDNTLHDFELIFIDASSAWPARIDWSPRVNELLDAGKTVVVFCSAGINNNLGRIFFLPLSFEQGSGSKIEFSANKGWTDFYASHVKTYNRYVTLADADLENSIVPLLGITDKKLIAFRLKQFPIYFLPQVTTYSFFNDDNGSATKMFIDLTHRVGGQSKSQPPEWVSDGQFTPNTVRAIDAEVESLRASILGTEAKISKRLAERTGLLKWRKLLYEGDNALEEVVSSSLELLGANLKPKFDDGTNELEHIFNVSGKCFVGDSKGKTRALVKDDISQLRTNVTAYESSEEAVVDGQIIFLNHYRNTSPADRNSPADKNLIDLARKFRIKIILTSDLFILVKALLDGDTAAKQKLSAVLLSDEQGLVRPELGTPLKQTSEQKVTLPAVTQ